MFFLLDSSAFQWGQLTHGKGDRFVTQWQSFGLSGQPLPPAHRAWIGSSSEDPWEQWSTFVLVLDWQGTKMQCEYLRALAVGSTLGSWDCQRVTEKKTMSQGLDLSGKVRWSRSRRGRWREWRVRGTGRGRSTKSSLPQNRGARRL